MASDISNPNYGGSGGSSHFPGANGPTGTPGNAPTRIFQRSQMKVVTGGQAAALGWANVMAPPFGAAGNGVADDTAAIQSAINSAAPNGGVIYLPAGTYKVTSTLTVSVSGTRIVGEAPYAVNIMFQPSASGPCFLFSAGANSLWDCMISGLQFQSTDTTYVKTMVKVVDVRHFLMDEVISAENDFHDSTSSSIGVWTCGREYITVQRSIIQADRPFVHDLNPNLSSNSLDYSVFRSLQLVVTTGVSQPNIYVVDGSTLSRNSWDQIDCALGTGAFYFHNTLSANASYNNVLTLVSDEQSIAGSTYSFDIVSTGAAEMQEWVLDSCASDPAMNGFRLGKFDWGTLRNCFSQAVSGATALWADNTSYSLLIDNLLYITSSLITGLSSVNGYWAFLATSAGASQVLVGTPVANNFVIQAPSGTSTINILSPNGTNELSLECSNGGVAIASDVEPIQVLPNNVNTANFATSGNLQLLGAIQPGTPAFAMQSGQMFQGSGAPSNSNGNNGDIYFRTDTPGTVDQRIYIKSAGSWVGIV